MYEDQSGQHCVDIDECSGTNICDVNADCYNELGGYSCRCRSGFVGNGYACELVIINQPTTTEENQQPEPIPTPNIPSLAPEHWLCDQCSEHSECFQGVCVCKSGWTGNGIECNYNCPPEYVWSIDRCVSTISTEDEDRKSSFENYEISSSYLNF